MSITVGELIEQLQNFHEDTPVRLATQQNYPIAYEIAGVVQWYSDDDEPRETPPSYRYEAELEPETGARLYIVEGDQVGSADSSESPYLPAAIWDEV